jgi:hypothetical protein
VFRPFAWSGTPQQLSRAKRPPFFFLLCVARAGELGWESPGVFVGPVPMPDWLLDVLPFRCLADILPLDSFECPPMLSLGSLTVAPLRPVDVGDGLIFCDDDLEGTCNRPRVLSFLGEVASRVPITSLSFALSAAVTWGFSSIDMFQLQHAVIFEISSTDMPAQPYQPSLNAAQPLLNGLCRPIRLNSLPDRLRLNNLATKIEEQF